MSLQPQEVPPVPDETRRIARAAFPKSNVYIRMRDALGAIYQHTFRTLFTVLQLFWESTLGTGEGRYRGWTMMGATTLCFYNTYSLITTACKLHGPFLPLRGAPQVFGLPARRTTDDQQVPCLQRAQTMADMALVTLESAHQLPMATRDHPLGPPVIGGHPAEDTLLKL
jgi:hypothetical protein